MIRVSGPAAAAAVAALTHRAPPAARHAALRLLFPPSVRGEGGPPQAVAEAPSVALGDTSPVSQGRKIDQALVLFFPAPASATGEDVAEFHVHGGRAVVEGVLDALSAVPGLRPAERGEFTRRAVENGKLDLTQAEGLADLIAAETQAQRAQALAHYEGALLRQCEAWRAQLIRLAAWAEAGIDFSDEELDADLHARLRAGMADLHAEIAAYLADGRRGEIVREGFHLTVVGPPNAGKSSLLNALARREVAIVSETPGTTRDVLEVRLDIAGHLVIAADTAGLREAASTIEAEGVRRALARAEEADLVLLLLDGAAEDPFAGLPPQIAQSCEALRAWNKADQPWPVARQGLRISAATGEGLAALLEEIGVRVQAALARGTGEAAAVTRLRHRRALEDATAALARALQEEKPPELVAEDLRLALRAIGRLTGRVDIEDLLDVIFRDFCIGK